MSRAGDVRVMKRAPRALNFGERLKRSWDVLLDLLKNSGQGASWGPFRGAEVTRIHPYATTGLRAADREIEWSLRTLRARARDLRRNNPYVEQYVNLLLANVIGAEGMDHQAQVRGAAGELDETINDAIEDAWRDWASGPVTADGKMNLTEFRDLQLETACVDGESFTRPIIGNQFRHGLALQSIDADLVDDMMNLQAGEGGPEVRMGVEIDSLGRPTGYYIWDRPDYGPTSQNRGRLRYDASEILHHYRLRRPNQTRGVSWLAPTILDLQDLDGFDEAVIVGARAGASQLGFVEWADPAAGAPSEDRTPAELPMNPGTVTELDPGQKFTGFTPEQPTAVYGPFTKTRLRRIAGGLGVPYNDLANDLEGVNYSSMRSGSQTARETWRKRQIWWISSFERRIHTLWLQTALLSGTLRLPSRDWRRYDFVRIDGRGWPWVDPLNDAETARLELELLLTSRQRLHRQRGSDYRKVLEEQIQEKADIDLAGLPMPAMSGRPPIPNPDPGADDAAGDGGAAPDAGANGSGSKNGSGRASHVERVRRTSRI